LVGIPKHKQEEKSMKRFITCVAIFAVLAAGCMAAPPPAAQPVAPTAVPPTVAPPAVAAQPDLLKAANAFMSALNRRDVEAAMAMFTDDAEYRAAHVGVGKAQVRTIIEYLDGTGLRLLWSDCIQSGQEVSCNVFGRDDAMAVYGTPGVRFNPYTFSFKDGKIQKIMGTADGPEWAANSASSKECIAWLTANRADEWKKVTDEKGVLIRNAQTAPEIIRLIREYGKHKK